MRSALATTVVLAALLCATTAHAATPAADPLPAALRPTEVAGVGFNVMDLEAERDWYVSRLGMQVTGVLGAKDKPFELILGFGEGPHAAYLALLRSSNRSGALNGAARLILHVPDAKALAARLAAEGAPTRELIPGTAYFVTDPEGNTIELYRAAPSAK